MQEFLQKRINEAAAILGLRKDLLYKEFILHSILDDLRTAFPKESHCIVGGTAVNKIYSKAPRFSEDIDYEFQDIKQSQVSAALKATGRQVTGPRTVIGNRFFAWTIHFDNEVTKKEDKIEVHAQWPHSFCSQVSEKPFNSLLNITSAAPLNKDDLLKPVKANSYSAEALLAEKLFAIMQRNEGKDYYDALQIFSQPINNRKVHSALRYLSPEFKFSKLLEKISQEKTEALSNQDAFIPMPFLPDWKAVKNTLAAKITAL